MMLRPHFSRQQYRNLNIFREHVDNLLACIPEIGGNIDLQPLFFSFTLDTTSAFLFGTSTYALRSDQSGDGLGFAKAFDTAQELVMRRFRIPDLYWLIGGSKFIQAYNVAHNFIDDVTRRRQASVAYTEDEKERYLIFDAIAKGSCDREALSGQLLNVLLAGRDTTACLLSWTFHLLAGHPQVLSRLQGEIKSVAGCSTDITVEDLRSMTYTTNVLKESTICPAFETT